VLAELLGHARPLDAPHWPDETVSTFEADGRVLVEDVVSPLQVPPHDNSAMDGYALRAADAAAAGSVLPVSQRIAAGAVPQPLEPGTAARIFTGAPVPPGADTVLMQEDCEAWSDAAGAPWCACASRPRRSGDPPRRRGRAWAAWCWPPASAWARPAWAWPPASGAPACAWRAAPRVALFSTGDELVMPGEVVPEQLPAGAIYNSNRFFLRALLQRMGCEVSDFGIVPDDLARTRADPGRGRRRPCAHPHQRRRQRGRGRPCQAGRAGARRAALLAAGDQARQAFAYGRVAQSHFIGLPGNPVSSFVTFLMLVRPFLLRLQGVQDVAPKTVALPAHFAGAGPTGAASSCACGATCRAAWTCSRTRARAC
jgi:molybdopterin molybdotransferase